VNVQGLDSTARFGADCQSILDNLLAKFGPQPSRDDRHHPVPERAVHNCDPKQARSEPGSGSWLLGRDRVYCAYEALLDGQEAAMVFTDPPYNVPIDGHAIGKGSIRHREFPIASGEMDAGQFTEFLRSAC
jgi:hypothetical protein